MFRGAFFMANEGCDTIIPQVGSLPLSIASIYGYINSKIEDKMEKFIIQGGTKLEGLIPVYGAKNSAMKCLAACLLTDEECVIDNVPGIVDVENILKIIEAMGVKVVRDGHKVTIHAKDLDPTNINQELVRKMRDSVMLIGSLLGRFKEVKIASPGGDKIGARQIETHLNAFIALGAEVTQENGFHIIRAKKLQGCEIILDEMSVTGTINAMLAAVLAEGTTTIRHAAAEPHVDNVMQLLNAMGAHVTWAGNHVIKIEGAEELHGAQHAINPDYIEMWTFLALGAATKSKISIQPFIPEYLETELIHFKNMGGKYEMNGDTLTLTPTASLHAPKQRVHSMPYPGFAADNIPPFVVLATQAEGTTLVMEWMYEGRQKYVYDLIRMGADTTILDPHRILIKGPTPLYGREATSYDIRAGATMIIAAMVAQGESVVTDIEQLDRGYERVEERLNAVGANIKRVKG